MNEWTITTGQVVGTVGERVWSQVGSETAQGKTTIVLVSLKNDEDSELLDLPQVGGTMLEELKAAGRESGSASELDRRVEQVSPPVAGIEVTLAVVVMVEQKIVISAGRGAKVYLKRGGRIGIVHPGGEVAVEGKGESGDVVTVATEAMIAGVGEPKWQGILQSGRGALEELAVVVHGKEDSSGMAAIMGEVSTQKLKLITTNWKIGLWGQRARGMFDRSLRVKPETKKVNTWVGVVLLLLLLSGVGIGFVKRAVVSREREIALLSEKVGQNLTEAESVADLNAERANYLVSQAKGSVDQFLAASKNDEKRSQAQELYGRIEEAEARMFKREQVEINILVDLPVLSEELTPTAVAADEENNVFIADKSAKVVGFNLDDRSSWVVDGGPYLDIAEYEGELFGLKADGVERLAKTGGGEREKVIEPDELWSDPRYVGVYGGNIYILDKAQGEIWKYPILAEGFGARRRWLGAGISLDFTYVADMFIDGDIWIITSSGKLERYSRGVPVTFAMEGMPYAERDRLSSPTAVTTSEEMVYVLEAGAKRVVALERESGKYSKQYVNEEFVRGKYLVIGEGRGYVVTDSRIVWFEL